MGGPCGLLTGQPFTGESGHWPPQRGATHRVERCLQSLASLSLRRLNPHALSVSLSRPGPSPSPPLRLTPFPPLPHASPPPTGSPPRAGSGSPAGDGDGDARAPRSRSRSRSPAGRPASPPKGGADGGGDAPANDAAPGPWKATLDALIADGKIREGELDTATFDALAALPAEQAALAVSRFADSNFSRINNKSGFLMGIVRRIQDEAADGPGAPPGAALDLLTGDLADVRAKLQAMIDDGRLGGSDIDRRMAKALADLGPRLADEAVEKFGQADLASIRSKAGFFVSCFFFFFFERRKWCARGWVERWDGDG